MNLFSAAFSAAGRRMLLNALVGLPLLVATEAQAQIFSARVLKDENIFEQAAFKSSHASTIVTLTHGKLMAAWFGGTQEGSPDVCIWTSVNNGHTWSVPVKTADGMWKDGRQYACWNPVLFKTHSGRLYLFYKAGPNPREWWGMYKVSTDNGKTWSPAAALPEGFLGPVRNKPVQVSKRKILYPSSVESKEGNRWTIHIETSDEYLRNWRSIPVDCDTFDAIQPTLLVYPDHTLQLLARSRQNVIVQSWSYDDGEHWTKVARTDLPNPNSGIDGVALPGHVQLLVYNPLPAGNNWWEGRGVLRLAVSGDGRQWKDIYTFEDHKSGEYSYPAIICDRSGRVHITYTSNRHKIKYVALRLAR